MCLAHFASALQQGTICNQCSKKGHDHLIDLTATFCTPTAPPAPATAAPTPPASVSPASPLPVAAKQRSKCATQGGHLSPEQSALLSRRARGMARAAVMAPCSANPCRSDARLGSSQRRRPLRVRMTMLLSFSTFQRRGASCQAAAGTRGAACSKSGASGFIAGCAGVVCGESGQPRPIPPADTGSVGHLYQAAVAGPWAAAPCRRAQHQAGTAVVTLPQSCAAASMVLPARYDFSCLVQWGKGRAGRSISQHEWPTMIARHSLLYSKHDAAFATSR